MRIEKATVISISDVTINEDAGTATFSVTSSFAVSSAFSVDFATADGTAVAGTDYTATSGTLNFTGTAAGETQTITVYLADDTVVESDETLLVNLSNLITNGQAITLAQTQATATVTDNDSASLSIADVTVNEGAGTATFTVTLDQAVQGGLSIDWTTADGTAVAGSDYTAGSGTLNFTGTIGETQTITITISDDAIVESDKNFLINLSNLQAGGLSVTMADAQATGTISNDDSAVVSIGDVTQAEGDSGTTQFTFTISIDNPVDVDITVDYTTVSDSADASDFTPVSGTASILAGQTSTTVTVDVTGEGLVEADEQFFVELSNLQASGRDVELDFESFNPEITLLETFDTSGSGSSRHVQIVGDIAYLAEYGNGSGLFILDISDPANPSEIGHFSSNYALSVYVTGTIAYLADGYSGLRILDISDPANIIQLGVYDTPNYAHDVKVVGDYAYIADYSSGLRILDISNPTNISEVGYDDTTGKATSLEVVDDTVYLTSFTGELYVFDVSDPQNLTELGVIDTLSLTYGVQIVGDLAYLADGFDGLRIINVSDPQNLTEIGSFDTTLAFGLQVVGNYAFVADSSHGLYVLDVSDASNILELAYYNTSGQARHLTVDGNILYVADDTAGLQVLRLDGLGLETRATGTITNDDSASLSIADVTVNESAGTATFTVTLDQAVQGGLSVDWSTADGTAVAGTDYTAGSGTLNFTGTVGETQTITVTISDDALVES
ncbi:MAG: hypothetical protein KDA77_14955, partial [Planctomycetaceae bacterium]|nr:hypothetical protein [Planctomycetaceae bacterium]